METNLIAKAVAAANQQYDFGGNMRLRMVDIIKALESAQMNLEDAGDILTVVAFKVDDEYTSVPYPEAFCEDAANLATEIQSVADDLYKLAGEEPRDLDEMDREPFDLYGKE